MYNKKIKNTVKIGFVFAVCCVMLMSGRIYADNNDMMFSLLLKHTYFRGDGSHGMVLGWSLHPETSPCPPKQEYKARLEVEYVSQDKTVLKIYQHGLDGMENAYGYFVSPLAKDNQRERLHTILVKHSPGPRHGLFQCDISDIPQDAQIKKATLILRLDCREGFAYADQSGEFTFFEMNRIWNWQHVDWEHYDENKKWTTVGGDYGDAIKTIHMRRDIKDLGYKKNTDKSDVPFDFTDYVKLLQERRVAGTLGNAVPEKQVDEENVTIPIPAQP